MCSLVALGLGPTCGVAAPMSCTGQSVFCCILRNFAFASWCVTPPPPPHGPWEHVPPHVWTDKSNSATTQDDTEDEAEVCVVSVTSTIVLSVLTPTLVGPMLFVKYNTYDIWSCSIHSHCLIMQRAL